jgi:hypothetical protein
MAAREIETLADLHAAVREELGTGPSFRIEISVRDRGDYDRLRPMLGKLLIEWSISVDDDGPIVDAPTPALAFYELQKALGRLDTATVEQTSKLAEDLGRVEQAAKLVGAR